METVIGAGQTTLQIGGTVQTSFLVDTSNKIQNVNTPCSSVRTVSKADLYGRWAGADNNSADTVMKITVQQAVISSHSH